MLYHIIKISSAFALAGFIYFIGMQGCSSVGFAPTGMMGCNEALPEDNCETRLVTFDCEERPDQAKCLIEDDPDSERRAAPPSQDFCEIKHELSLGQVDILFVIDNSGSMSVEHRSLARQFNSFLNDIKNVNYHLAVITTDISSSPNNPNRNQPFQDGRFISIGGRPFLSNENLGSSPDRRAVKAFQQAIERKETKDCDAQQQRSGNVSENEYDNLRRRIEERESQFQSNDRGQKQSKCPPSSDERGSYAVMLAAQNSSHRSFFRPKAHLMVIFLSDEDIRSGEGFYNQTGNGKFKPEPDKDTPEALVSELHKLFPKKTYSFYSIVIPPGDSQCLYEQNRYRNSSGRGYYGKEYARLSKDENLREYGNILTGKVISICQKNYGHQLRKVAVLAQVSRVFLFCPNPDRIDLELNGNRVESDQQIEGRTLLIRPMYGVPLSARITVRELCPLDPGQKCEDTSQLSNFLRK